MKLRLILLSDTHALHHRLSVPDGDVLIHAGDITRWGELEDLRRFNDFLGGLPHAHKLVIAGNHDFCLEIQPAIGEAILTNCTYLRDSGVTIEGVRFYGSPWQPRFCDLAFNLDRGVQIRAKWDLIPPGTDVLITHGPPFGYGDLTLPGERAGCQDLLEAVARIEPRLHVFGHIHEGYGAFVARPTTFVNASVCDVHYQPIQPPVVFDYEE